MRFRGGENELYVGGRFFQRLEERVERRDTKHVNLVNDVDLIGAAGRSVLDVLAQIPNLFYAIVGGSVDFEDVQIVAPHDLLAGIAGIARPAGRPVFTVQGLRENPSGSGFPGPAGPDEKVRMRHAAGCNSVPERGRDMFLSDNILEPLRPPLAG